MFHILDHLEPSDMYMSLLIWTFQSYHHDQLKSLIGYFSHKAYKILDRGMGAFYKSCDVIFEEGNTYFTQWPY